MIEEIKTITRLGLDNEVIAFVQIIKKLVEQDENRVVLAEFNELGARELFHNIDAEERLIRALRDEIILIEEERENIMEVFRNADNEAINNIIGVLQRNLKVDYNKFLVFNIREGEVRKRHILEVVPYRESGHDREYPIGKRFRLANINTGEISTNVADELDVVNNKKR